MPTLRDIACDVFVFRTRRQPGISLGTWKTTRSSVIDVSYAAKALPCNLLMTSRVVAYTMPIPAHVSRHHASKPLLFAFGKTLSRNFNFAVLPSSMQNAMRLHALHQRFIASRQKSCHSTSLITFTTKCSPIFKILSLLDLAVNFQQHSYQITNYSQHLKRVATLHVKCEESKLAEFQVHIF